MTAVRVALRPTWQSWGWVFVAVAVLRAPGFFFGVLDIDETDFWTVGAQIADGSLRHLDVLPNGLPLTYLYFNLLVPVGMAKADIFWAQLLAVFWVFATCRVAGAAAARLADRSEAGYAAGWLCAFGSACNVLSVNAEITLNLPAAVALWYFVRAEREGRWQLDLCAGVWVGVATLFKQQAGIYTVALGAGLLVTFLLRPTRASFAALARRGAALAGGFALPIAAAASVYFALVREGALSPESVEHALVTASAGSVLGLFGLGLFLYVVAATPVLWVLAVREHGRLAEPARRTLALCLWLTWIPVSLGGRFYGHYYLQFVVPLAVLAGPGLSALVLRWRGGERRWRRLVAAGLALPVGFYFLYAVTRGVLGRYPGQDAKVAEIAAWLRENTAPSARIFVWGHIAPIYYFSKRLPGTRHRNSSVHVGDFDPAHIPPGFDLGRFRSDDHVRTTIEDLERNEVEVVVDTAPANIHDWAKVPLAVVPALQAYLRERYERVGEPGGAHLYRRRARR